MSQTQHRIADYLLLESLSRGPGAAAYRALDSRDGRRVILRQAAEGPSGPDFMRREIGILSKVRHPAMVRLIDSGESDGRPYCVLAHEEGVTLDALPAVLRTALDQSSLLELLGPLMDALARLHEAGFLHGDLSPRNILLRPDGQPLLVDFGAAEPLVPEPGLPPRPLSTPGFAAPERGSEAGQGPWTDLYALAAVACWLIAGKPPGAAGNGVESAGGGRFSAEFLQAVDWALAAEGPARPASVEAWRQALLAAPLPAGAGGPALALLAGAVLDREEVELPPPDEVPATALLRPEARMALALRPLEAPDRAARPDRLAAGGGRRGGRRSGGRPWLAALALLILVAAMGAGGWWGWGWYQTYTKRLWLVDPAGGGDTVSIGEAVARAAAGSTIRIKPGVYAESLTVARPLHLESAAEGPDGPVISPVAGGCLLFRAPTGSLSGLAFEGGDGTAACLEVAGGEVEILDVRLGPWNGTGLLLRDGADPVIRNSRFADIDGAAILVEGGARGRIEDNLIEATAKSAITVRGGAEPAVRNNRILRAAQAGLLIDQGSRGLYADNEIVDSGASAIEVRGGAAPQVARNQVHNAGQAGLFVHGGAGGEYLGNAIAGSQLSGVVITGGATPLLADNEIRDSAQHGVLVVGAGGRIERNRISGNAGHGIVLGAAATAELADNDLSKNRRPQVRRLEK